MRYDQWISQLHNVFRTFEHNPKQTQREYNLERLDAWFAVIDGEFDREKNANQSQQLRAQHIFTLPDGSQDIVVRAVDFSDFCKQNKLSEKEMDRLSNGLISEYKG